MSEYYTIKPFEHNGAQIPALHHIHRNVHTFAWLGYFKPDKIMINLKGRAEWMDAFAELNNNGPKSRAFPYLKQLTSGVFQPWPKFQPCIFATADFAPNRVHVLNVDKFYQGIQYAEIEVLNLNDDPPTDSIDALMGQGFVHQYVVIGKQGALSRLPKDNGHVYIFVASIYRMYIELNKLEEIPA